MLSHVAVLACVTVCLGLRGIVSTDFLSIVPSESRLHAQEDIRGPLSELQQEVLPDIQDQIQDYRYRTSDLLVCSRSYSV